MAGRIDPSRSPRAAVAWRSGRYQVQASAYHANRTPSLNELHRRFAAGTAITNANPLLDPETLVTGDNSESVVNAQTAASTYAARNWVGSAAPLLAAADVKVATS